MRVLRIGMRGDDIAELQTYMVELGYQRAIAPGVFDIMTKQAVIGFQARHLDERGVPLVPDGEAGPLTWQAIQSAVGIAPSNMPAPAEEARPDCLGEPKSKHGFEALQVAIQELYAGATEVGANNAGPYVEKYLNGIAPAPANWCAAFVSWCFSQTTKGIPFRYSLGARDVREQFKKKDWLYDPGMDSPAPGDLIFWWRDQPDGWMGHIGFVCSNKGGFLTTIEGNKGSFPARVARFNYVLGRIDQLLGFGRVPD